MIYLITGLIILVCITLLYYDLKKDQVAENLLSDEFQDDNDEYNYN